MFDDRMGRLNKDQIVEMNDEKAEFYVARGYANVYVAKVVDEQPAVEVQAEKKRPRKTKVVED